ncbi:MAG: hypothetical protein U9R75_09010 [Candidatus Thermoplasmatota archaeon]|nr:hypothetical protein [Candidatus Thermoplasmatota archaeon]
MEGPVPEPSRNSLVLEGKISLDILPSGGLKGPGKKDGVFYNPAMVQNRDLSVLFMQVFVDDGMLPGSHPRILDPLTGAGTRAIRFAREVEDCPPVTGCDINPASIGAAVENARLNKVDVEFLHEDLREHLLHRRYSYVDIDPFGSPLPFIESSLDGILDRGIIAVTATDTAALTGSIPRVARRRYGVELSLIHSYQEMSCRVLVGALAARAASLELSIEPLFFYSHDHFIRGDLRVKRGARRADKMLDKMSYARYQKPFPPMIFDRISDVSVGGGSLIGPFWSGPLEDIEFLERVLLGMEKRDWTYLSSYKNICEMLDHAVTESRLPPFGFDVNETSSSMKCSPPGMKEIQQGLIGLGYSFSRSRFSPTIFKTDASTRDVKELFSNGSVDRWSR